MSMDLNGVTLKVTPEILNAKANEANGKINLIKQHFDSLEENVSRTKAYWIGEAGDMYRKLFEQEKESIEEIIKRLSEHPKDLQAIAQVYSDVELKAAEIAEELPGDVLL